MSLLVRSAAAALRRTRGFPQRRPYSGSSSRQVDMYVLNRKINDVAKRVLVKETIECYIDDSQFQFNENNIWTAWIIAGICLSGFLMGRSAGIIYDKYEMKRGTV